MRSPYRPASARRRGGRPAGGLPRDARRRRRSCAIEVSSHALALGRADAVHFAAAIFTNLTQDHLDFHASMEDYFQAKRRLFATDPGVSVVNVGDPYGRRLVGEIDGALITFAVERDGNAVGRGGNTDGEAGERDAICADYRATDVRCDFGGCHFALHTPDGAREVALPLAGRFNVANALGALAAAHALGGELDVLVERSSAACACRGASRPSMRARTSRCWSTTPTHPTRSRTCSAPPAS